MNKRKADKPRSTKPRKRKIVNITIDHPYEPVEWVRLAWPDGSAIKIPKTRGYTRD